MGKKKNPTYRIVSIDSRKKRDGEYLELIGTYNPISKELKINDELYKKYISTGAQPTEIVENLYKQWTKSN